MRNLVIMFLVAMVFTVLLFIFPHVQTGTIILLTLDIFALFIYSVIKFKQHETISKQYELELKRRLELEQELMKEIEFSNSVISKTYKPLNNNSG